MKNNNGRGIFYGVIGVATLVVAIIGATFAYFTATANNINTIQGNAASISFSLSVEKVTHVDEAGGMIPMSNSMVEAALHASTGDSTYKTDTGTDPQICLDDNGNGVCQVYKISVNNGSTAAIYLDGYVSIVGGSGEPIDFVGKTGNLGSYVNLGNDAPKTTMRWAQAFCTVDAESGKLSACSTGALGQVGGKTTTGATTAGGNTAGIDTAWAAISETAQSGSTAYGFARSFVKGTTDTVTTPATLNGNSYNIIDQNYIRISDHTLGEDGQPALNYTQTADKTSALVLNQFLSATAGHTIAATTDSSETYTDAQVYYIVVWLSESSQNQSIGSGEEGSIQVPAEANNFFSGTVYFASAQGSEVTATFSGYNAVKANTANDYNNTDTDE